MTDRRKRKNRFNRARRYAKFGNYGIGCRGHIGVVTQADHGKHFSYWGEFELTSLEDGIMESCSTYHCGLEPLSKREALERVDYKKRNGEAAYVAKYYPGYAERLERELAEARVEGWDWAIQHPTSASYLGISEELFRKLWVERDLPD